MSFLEEVVQHYERDCATLKASVAEKQEVGRARGFRCRALGFEG